MKNAIKTDGVKNNKKPGKKKIKKILNETNFFAAWLKANMD